jgi:hypothetical protein
VTRTPIVPSAPIVLAAAFRSEDIGILKHYQQSVNHSRALLCYEAPQGAQRLFCCRRPNDRVAREIHRDGDSMGNHGEPIPSAAAPLHQRSLSRFPLCTSAGRGPTKSTPGTGSSSLICWKKSGGKRR